MAGDLRTAPIAIRIDFRLALPGPLRYDALRNLPAMRVSGSFAGEPINVSRREPILDSGRVNSRPPYGASRISQPGVEVPLLFIAGSRQTCRNGITVDKLRFLCAAPQRAPLGSRAGPTRHQ